MAYTARELEYELKFLSLKIEHGIPLTTGEQGTWAFYGTSSGGCPSCYLIRKQLAKLEVEQGNG